MKKKIKHAVAVIIKNKKGEVLFGLRNRKKDSHPLTWSLPSHYVIEGERFEDTVKRIGRQKLSVTLKPTELIAERKSDRGNFILFMHDYEAKITKGIPRPNQKDIYPYEKLEWSIPEKKIRRLRKMGDCIKAYKQYLGM